MKDSKEKKKANPLRKREPLFNKSSLFQRLLMAETVGVGFSTLELDPASSILVGSTALDII